MRARATNGTTTIRRRLTAVVVAMAMIATSLSLILGATAGVAEAARAPGELVRYDFSEGSGTTVGDSGSGAALDLTISNLAAVTWVPEGLQINSSVSISAPTSTKIVNAVAQTNAFTVEAWVTPAVGQQSGPARMVSSSLDPNTRNFMLGQGAFSNLPNDVFVARTRTSTSLKGEPNLFTSTGTAGPVLTHVVLTRNAAGARTIYVDGAVVASGTLSGNLANWNASYPFVVGNEGTGNRPWLGTVCLVAMYDKALSAGEVSDNFADGCGTPNNPPTLDPVGNQAHDEGVTVALPVTAADVDGDTLTFSATNLPDGLSIAAVDATSAMISGTITQTAATGSEYTTEITVDDGSGGVDSESLSWTVNAVNVDPVLDAIGDQASGEGQTINLAVAAFDVDGDTLAFSAVGLPPSLSINAGTGVISGVVDPGTATYNTTVTVDDGNGGSASESFVWEVIGNADPILDPVGDQTNDEGDSVNLTLTASDGDGDTLTFSATGLPSGLSISGAGVISGTVTQTAASGSVYSTVITVSDGKGGNDSEALSWTVNAVNVNPTVSPVPNQTSTVGSSVNVSVTANDADGDALTFSAAGLPAGLTINPSSGQITGTPTAAGTSATTITAADGNGGSGSTTLSWTVNPAPSGPSPIARYEFSEGAGTTVGDTGSGAPLNLTISNPNAVTWTADGLRVDSSVVISANNSTKIAAAVASTNQFTVEAWVTPADIGEQSGPARIVSSSESPFARNFMLSQGAYGSFPDDVFAARTRTSTKTAGTPDLFTSSGTANPTLTHVVLTRSANGVRTIYVDGAAAGSGTLTGNLGNWNASFDLVVANVAGGSRPWLGELCEIAIYDVALTSAQIAANFSTPCGTPVVPNNPPTLNAVGDQNNPEGATISLTVSGADADGDSLSFAAANLPDGLTIAPVDATSALISGTITQTAASGSIYSTDVSVDDGNGGSVTESIDWTVTAVNVDPVLDPIGDQSSGEGAAISLPVSASDEDADTLAYSAINLPATLSINPTTGLISGTIDPGTATYNTTVTVDDGFGGTASETFVWDVIGNEAPVITSPGDQTNDEGDAVNLPVAASDDDLDPLTFSATDLPDGLSIDSSGTISGTISQTAASGSVYATVITVDDGNGGTDSATISWTVNTINLDPVIAPIGDQTDAVGSNVNVGASATDGDGDTLSFTATGLPTGLAIDGSTGDITGVPTTAGSSSVTVQVDDGFGGVDSTTFNWTINAVTGPAPLVRYEFTEGSGLTVADSGTGSPLNLTIDDPGAVSWVPGRGLTIDSAVVIGSSESSKIATAVGTSNEVTVEAWISPAPIGDQTGPARIVSSSPDAFSRNFMLGQGAFGSLADDVFSARTRTTNSIGGTPTLLTASGNGHGDPQLTHVVLTRDANGERNLYVDGVLTSGATDTVGGDLGNWDGSFPLLLGNSGAGDRPWIGTFCEVAVYDAALTAGQVSDRFAVGCTLPAAPPQALIQVTPGQGLNSSTYGNGTITVTNTGGAEAPAITNVTFDLRGSLIPDATFDPIGTAGDEVQQCLNVSVEGGTGFIAPGDPCTDPFSLPHEDDPGVPGNGHDAMELNFNDFQTGESIVFGVDVDPTTIQGGLGSGGAGSVSGLELTGSVVIVTFDDNSSLIGKLFGDGSAGGAQAVVSTSVAQVAPTDIEMLGVTTGPSVFTNNSEIGGVAATGDQIVRVSGPEGALVNLLAVTGVKASPGSFDLDPFESDAASAVQYQTGTITGGFADFTVAQPDAAALYHYVATIDDGATGPTSKQLVIAIGDVNSPVLDPIDDVAVIEGDTISIVLNAVDPQDDPLVLSVASNPDIEALGAVVVDNGDGTGTIDWVTEPGDLGVYTVDVTASDGSFTSTESFTISVGDPNGPPALVRYEFDEGAGSVVADTGSGTGLDLTISDPAAVTWVTGGLQIDSSVVVGSTESSKIVDAVALSNEFSIEAWIRPDSAGEQSGPARIVANAPNASSRNFMLGQGAFSNLPDDVFSARTLTTTGGSSTTLFTATGNADPSLQHVVLTRDTAGVRTIYVNGVAAGSDTVAGDLSNWNPANPLVIGNVGDGSRPWLGTVCEVAVYNSALTDVEVVGNFAQGCDVAGPSGAALVQITPGGALGATTFGNATITVSNVGTVGSPSITNVLFDVRGSLIPDATFDPIGTAGDEGTQCLAVSNEGGTGFVVPSDPCTDPFSLPHEDDPGVPANGWDAMELDFSNFDIGESIVFGVDVDPTSIQGVPGAGGSGAISGLELTGSRVIVTFSDGSSVINNLFGDGSNGGGQAYVGASNGQLAPTIEMIGVLTSPTVFPNDSFSGLVGAAGPQTVRVSGPEGATVNLLGVTGEVGSPTPFDLDPFESDAATVVTYQTGVVSGGFVDFTVAQPDDTKLYHYVATVEVGGNNGATSSQLVIGFGDVDTPVLQPISNVIVDEGATVSVALDSSDPNGDTITLGLSSTPDIEALGAVLTDNGDGTGSIDWPTEAGDAGNYTVDVTASDGTNTATESFTITVVDPNAAALYRVNAGGPLVSATDGGIDWSADQATLAADAGGTAVVGTPSPYWISGEDKTYGTADAIDLSDGSIPAGTAMALFQTERYDPPAGTELVYEFPISSGASYVVDLYFAEIFATADGIREFAVDIEGTQVLGNYDIHALVGHDAGIVASFVTPVVADDALTITFTHQVENPKVNAIEVRTAGPPPTDVPPQIAFISDETMIVGGSLPIDITTFEPDGDPVTLSVVSTPDASLFTTFTDDGDGTGNVTFTPIAGDAGVYTIDVTATDVDGTDTETFTLTVNDPPAGGTVFARINSAGPLVAAIDGGPDWEADANPGHPFLSNGGSNGNSGFAANDPGPTVPATVPGAVFDTERWSTSGFSYGVPVTAGTQVFVRLFLGNGFPGTSTAGSRVFDISIDGTLVENDFDMIPAFGHQVGGMLEYLITSDGTVDIAFANVVENPLVNAIEVISATSSPGVLGASPASIDFGLTALNSSATQTVSLTNLGFDAGDPSINITSVAVSGGEFTTDFSGPVGLGPSGSTTFDVVFAPTNTSPQSETLTITHTGTNSPLIISLDGTGSSDIPIGYGGSGVSGESSNNPTSLAFGPDDRLYVVQQDATIKAYTMVRNGPNDYTAASTETINLVKTGTPNHNDDGSANTTQQRQSTGILTTGTPTNPVLYVSSSDWRIGGGGGGGDTNLDTNSGVISRLTWNGASWDKVDIVRGLPRSEENHASNGMALDEATNTLYLMQGGHANKGAPSNNFSGTPEYYLSAALLSIDLDAINALPVLNDGTTDYVYNLPTLDDPGRSNTNGTDRIDVGDPFGGNNGLNQAVPEPGGPVQVFSPGYRNAFDVVLTENGRLYTSDNGPNTGWGGLPLLDGSGNCINQLNEAGSNGHGDPLHFIDGAGYYGGHPAPIRAFPATAGIYNYTNSGGWSSPPPLNFGDLLPTGLTLADFPNNPIECDYTSNDPAKYLDIIGASTNGITEYTASNFGGAMKGDILTASFNGNIYRYKLNAAGDAYVLKESLFSGFGSQPLDVIAQGDDDPFPGSIWAVTYGADNVTVFEPQDFGSCSGADDDQIDEDLDGYSNADEIDNGTNPCSGGSKPDDNDGDNLSDLNDDDDDNDGILDVDDEFAIDADNGTTTNLPVLRPFDNGDPGTGFFGLGLTGLMTNGTTDYLDQFDVALLDAGGATAKLGVTEVSAGDAYQAVNSQQNAFQYGINVDSSTAPFVVSSAVESPFFDGLTPVNFQSAGIFMGPGDQDNYLKVVLNANAGNGGIQVLLETNGTAVSATQYGTADYGADALLASDVGLLMVVDPAALTVQPQVSIDGATPVDLGTPVTVPASWFSAADAQGLAVGVISTSTGNGAPVFNAVWDFLDVDFVGGANTPPTITPIGDDAVAETVEFTFDVVATDADAGDTLSYALSGDVPAGMAIDAAGQITFTPDFDDSGSYAITVEVDDGVNPVVTEDFVLDVTQTDPAGGSLHRINVGGPQVAAADASAPDWAQDEAAPNASPFFTAGSPNIYGPGAGIAPNGLDHPTVPGSVPQAVFEKERFDVDPLPEMTWEIPVAAGTEVEVRLFWAELYGGISGTTEAGDRLIDVEIDGIVVETGIDPFDDGGGLGFATVTDYLVTSDGTIDIRLLHNEENPALKGIEILEIGAAPNVAPTIDSFVPASPVSVTQNAAMSTITVNASDANGDTITLTTDGNEPAGVTFTDTGGGVGEFTGTPTAAPGTYPVEVTVEDGEPLSSSATIEIIITTNTAPTITPIADQAAAENVLFSLGVVANDPDAGDTLSYALSGDVPAGMTIDASGQITFTPDLDDSGVYPITVEVDDGVNPVVTEDFALSVSQTDIGTVIRRINVGGPAPDVAATDAGPDWTANPNPNTVTELVAGGDNVFLSSSGAGVVVADVTNPTVPASTPIDVFQSERWDPPAGQEMAWNFGVDDQAVVEVRIGIAEIYNGNTAVGGRVFDVAIDGATVQSGVDPILLTGGQGIGYVLDYVVTTDADGLDLQFLHVVGGDNPSIKSIEIREITPGNPTTQAPLVIEKYVGDTVLYRVNAGGALIAATDGGPDWTDDAAYIGGGPVNTSSTAAAITTDPSVPATTPDTVFATERWDPAAGSEMSWNFPVTQGTPIEVRLYFADFNGPTQVTGARVFDVSIDGDLALDDFDIFDDAGANTGVMKTVTLVADADGVDIDFQRVVENPEIRAIEIIELATATTVDVNDTVGYTVRIENPSANTENADVTAVTDSVDGGTPVPLAECQAALPASLSPGQALTCSWTDVYAAAATYTDVVAVTATFDPSASSADGSSNIVSVTVDPPANPAPTIDPIADQLIDEATPLSVQVTANDADPLTYALSGDVPSGMTIDSGGLISFIPDFASSGRYAITAEVDDGVNPVVTESFELDVTQAAPPGSAIHRVNVGSGALAATDSSYPDYAQDQASPDNYPYYTGGGAGFATGNIAPINMSHPTVPTYVPTAVFNTERYGPTTWAIPVDSGTEVEVRLYWAEVWTGIAGPGGRTFDVTIDGNQVETGLDVYDRVGPGVAYVTDYIVTSDGTIDIGLLTGVQSPALKGIEILGISGLRSVALTSPLEGATIDTDSVLIEWDLHGFLDANDHVHVILDGVLPHTSIFRPDTELLFENLTVGSHTVTLQVADVTHTVYPNPEAFQSVTFTVAPPTVTRINAGGAEVAPAAGDTGPVWQADTPHPTLVSSNSTTGGYATNSADASLPTYADIADLFMTERYDGTNAGAPVMSYSIPVLAGATFDVNLFFQNGYNGTQNPLTRQFDVYIEGGLVLDDFDLITAYGHRIRGMETFSIVDDGDGVILIEFVHGPIENPLINALEVVQTS